MLPIDKLALELAYRLAEQQPRCDYTIPQLPSLVVPSSSDLLVISHNGTDYGITLQNAVSSTVGVSQSGVATNVRADQGASAALLVPITFSPEFGGIPAVQLTVGIPSANGINYGSAAVAVTASGFSIWISGGAPLSTVTVNWTATYVA